MFGILAGAANGLLANGLVVQVAQLVASWL